MRFARKMPALGLVATTLVGCGVPGEVPGIVAFGLRSTTQAQSVPETLRAYLSVEQGGSIISTSDAAFVGGAVILTFSNVTAGQQALFILEIKLGDRVLLRAEHSGVIDQASQQIDITDADVVQRADTYGDSASDLADILEGRCQDASWCTTGYACEADACARCGDDIKQGDEECDGVDLGGASCTSIGFQAGTLDCDTSCYLDTTDCTGSQAVCPNGITEPNEDCDGAEFPDTCVSLGLGFSGGVLVCDTSCAYDTAGCTVCGNTIVEGTELCDNTDMGGFECSGFGFSGGAIACDSSTCILDLAGCTGTAPLAIVPASARVVPKSTVVLQASGGNGSYNFTLEVNGSGATLDPSGVYTAGETTDVTDTVRVTDSLSATADATITVTTAGQICGDTYCDPPESPAACPVDCGTCGNGTCDLGDNEDGTNCATDCYCGDGVCDPTEDAAGCSPDCGDCDGQVAGTPCADTTPTDCYEAQCDGAGECVQTRGLESVGTVCRPAGTNPCDVEEACNGVNGDCPSDGYETAGTNCSNGTFCDGPETCDSMGSCIAGTAPCPAALCNEPGQYCLGCAGDDDCPTCQECDGDSNCINQPDGMDAKWDCSACSICNGFGGCRYASVGTACEDGFFCTDPDSCNGSGVCLAGAERCPSCDEVMDNCPGECVTDGDCPSCKKCNASNMCIDQTVGEDIKADCPPEPCLTGSCDGTGACGLASAGTSCTDGWYCTGEETCDGSGNCSPGSDPCPGGQCDEANDGCTYCGDGQIDPSETCDDNNASPGDGCSDSCQVESYWSCINVPSECYECGDGGVDPTEICDDGINDGSYGGCIPGCQSFAPHCGDSAVDAGDGEMCDDGVNDGSYNGCASDCMSLAAYCGDNLIDYVYGELCDGSALDGKDCINLGYSGGTLGCMPDCFDFDAAYCDP